MSLLVSSATFVTSVLVSRQIRAINNLRSTSLHEALFCSALSISTATVADVWCKNHGKNISPFFSIAMTVAGLATGAVCSIILAKYTKFVITNYTATQIAALHLLVKISVYSAYQFTRITPNPTFSPFQNVEALKNLSDNAIGEYKAHFEVDLKAWDAHPLRNQIVFNSRLRDKGQPCLKFTNFSLEGTILTKEEAQLFAKLLNENITAPEAQILFDYEIDPSKYHCLKDSLPNLDFQNVCVEKLSREQALWYHKGLCIASDKSIAQRQAFVKCFMKYNISLPECFLKASTKQDITPIHQIKQSNTTLRKVIGIAFIFLAAVGAHHFKDSVNQIDKSLVSHMDSCAPIEKLYNARSLIHFKTQNNRAPRPPLDYDQVFAKAINRRKTELSTVECFFSSLDGKLFEVLLSNAVTLHPDFPDTPVEKLYDARSSRKIFIGPSPLLQHVADPHKAYEKVVRRHSVSFEQPQILYSTQEGTIHATIDRPMGWNRAAIRYEFNALLRGEINKSAFKGGIGLSLLIWGAFKQGLPSILYFLKVIRTKISSCFNKSLFCCLCRRFFSDHSPKVAQENILKVRNKSFKTKKNCL